MTRPTNPDISSRILEAAQSAWVKGGDRAFDVRSIAAAAETTVATLYSRFASRDELLKALRRDALAAFYDAMGRASSVDDFCRTYLKFAERRPRDYDLIFGPRWQDRSEPDGAEALTLRLTNRVANELACDGTTARGIGLQLWLLLHGAASQRVADDKARPLWVELKAACLDGCTAILEGRGHGGTAG